MDQSRVDKITEYVVMKINSGKSGMDISSAFDCAGFSGTPEDDTDPIWGKQHITGIAEFKEWLKNYDECEMDLEYGSPYKAACQVYQYIKRENKAFGDYWDGNINMPY